MANVIKQDNAAKIVAHLRQGGLAVLRTDTVYGVVCSAQNKEAVQALYRLKHREKKPGTIIAASLDQLVELGLKRRYLIAVEEYWPGAVSVVIPTSDPRLLYVHDGLGSVAMRVVAGPEWLVRILKKTGPLLTTSANTPGNPPAKNIEQAAAYFGDAVGLYVDGGFCDSTLGSTIVRVVDDTIEVLRQGGVEINEPE